MSESRSRRRLAHLFTTSPAKAGGGLKFGARESILSSDSAKMAAHANRFDFVLDTISAAHDVNALLSLLKRDGVLTQVGVPAVPYSISAGSLLAKRHSLAAPALAE